MKKTLLTIAATSGIAFAGFAGVASAQSYGDAEPTATTVVAEEEAPTGVSTLQTAEDEAESTEATEDGERHGRRGGCNLDAAAEAIGIDADELRTALDEGQSIADVATTNGVDPDAVVDAMVAAKAERLTEKVDEGRLTQDEADERLVEETAEIEDRVSGSNDEEAGS